MQIVKKEFALQGADNEIVRGDLRYPDEPSSDKFPTLIFCHGFKGFKDWGCWPYFCEQLCRQGFAVIIFNFAHNGIGEKKEEFTRLDLFQRGSISKSLQDIRAVVDALYIKQIPGADKCDTDRLGMIGHSLGGGKTLLYAAYDARIKAIAALAPISYSNRFPEHAKQYAQEHGFYPVLNTRTNQDMPIGLEYFTDLEKNKERLSVERAVRKLQIPFLLIHGDQDETVPKVEAKTILMWSNPRLTTMLWIAGGTHTFGIEHPFHGTTPHLEQVIQAVSEFFRAASTQIPRQQA